MGKSINLYQIFHIVSIVNDAINFFQENYSILLVWLPCEGVVRVGALVVSVDTAVGTG